MYLKYMHVETHVDIHINFVLKDFHVNDPVLIHLLNFSVTV